MALQIYFQSPTVTPRTNHSRYQGRTQNKNTAAAEGRGLQNIAIQIAQL